MAPHFAHPRLLVGGSQGFYADFTSEVWLLQGLRLGPQGLDAAGARWAQLQAAGARDAAPEQRWGHTAVSWRGQARALAHLARSVRGGQPVLESA